MCAHINVCGDVRENEACNVTHIDVVSADMKIYWNCRKF